MTNWHGMKGQNRDSSEFVQFWKAKQFNTFYKNNYMHKRSIRSSWKK